MPHPSLQPPSPFEILNSVFSQLASLSAADTKADQHFPDTSQHSTTWNASPLTKAHTLPSTARPYLLTLHVLFPHLLLPALDLLDHGLVTRIVLASQATTSDDDAEPAHDSDGTTVAANITTTTHDTSHHNQSATAEKTVLAYETTSTSILYSNPSRYNRRSYGTTGTEDRDADTHTGGKKYHVSLTGWSCSCPAFALAAFGEDAAATQEDEGAGGSAGARPGSRGRADGEDDWAEITAREPYGVSQTEAKDHHALGLGLGGLMMAEVGFGSEEERAQKLPPLCKHLLAVALGEWCGNFFGARVGSDEKRGGEKWSVRGMKERTVTLEEAAGWAAGASL